MRFDGRIRHLGSAPIAAIQSLLPSVSEAVWLSNPFRQQVFKMHRQTRSLIFRHISGEDPAEHYDLPPWRAWQGVLQPTLAAVEAAIGPGCCCRILLASLPPSRRIFPHRDRGSAYEMTHRVHVPIQTDPQVRFSVDGEDHHLEAGEIYEVNNLLEHGVTNESRLDRVHLIVDFLEHGSSASRSMGN